MINTKSQQKNRKVTEMPTKACRNQHGQCYKHHHNYYTGNLRVEFLNPVWRSPWFDSNPFRPKSLTHSYRRQFCWCTFWPFAKNWNQIHSLYENLLTNLPADFKVHFGLSEEIENFLQVPSAMLKIFKESWFCSEHFLNGIVWFLFTGLCIF